MLIDTCNKTISYLIFDYDRLISKYRYTSNKGITEELKNNLCYKIINDFHLRIIKRQVTKE